MCSPKNVLSVDIAKTSSLVSWHCAPAIAHFEDHLNFHNVFSKNLQILEQHHIRCSECSRIVSCLSFTSLIQFHEICKQKIAKISFAAASTSWKSGCWSQASALGSAKLTPFFSVFRGSFGLGEGKHSCKGTWQFLAPKFVCGFCPLLVVRDGKEFVDS